MATLQQRKNLTRDPQLHDLIKVAAYDVANAVLQDAGRSGEHPFFQAIIMNPEGFDSMPLAWVVAYNPTIGTQFIDTPQAFSDVQREESVQFVVVSSITKFSVPTSTEG